jgi:bacterioferritin (cytochrome b1)
MSCCAARRSVDWLAAQLHVVGEIGRVRYLAEQLGSDGD